jgi:hypothetical protein
LDFADFLDFFPPVDFLELDFRAVDLFEPEDFFFAGTFLPFWRASERPMAIACLRLVTFFPLRPLLSVPRLRLCIALFTSLEALGEYFRAICGPPIRLLSPAAAGEPVGAQLMTKIAPPHKVKFTLR